MKRDGQERAKHQRKERLFRRSAETSKRESAPSARPRARRQWPVFGRGAIFSDGSAGEVSAYSPEIALLGFVRSAFPRVLFIPPSTFKAGFPNDYAIGEVSYKYKKEFRVWIVREVTGFYVLFAKCTHLGCTPRWLAAENKFKCPCHGSGYHKSGVNFEGPAPRPMDRFRVTLADDGEILVDTSVKYRFERSVGQARCVLEGLVNRTAC